MGGEREAWGEGNGGDKAWGWKPWLGVPVGGMREWATLMARERTLAREKRGWSGGGQ